MAVNARAVVVYLRWWDDFAYSHDMAYVFPYENVFVSGMVILIVALLILRMKVVRQRRTETREIARVGESIEQTKARPPLV